VPTTGPESRLTVGDRKPSGSLDFVGTRGYCSATQTTRLKHNSRHRASDTGDENMLADDAEIRQGIEPNARVEDNHIQTGLNLRIGLKKSP
jgi:hypothetical protein